MKFDTYVLQYAYLGVKVMYKAIDVARHIVNYINCKDETVSNLKLQKLLYFVQGFYLALIDQPCFEDEIEAWDFGPVVPNVYREFKKYGSNSIPTIKRIYIPDRKYSKIQEYVDEIDGQDKAIIDRIIDSMSKYSTTSLVEITHKQSPWKNAYNPFQKHIRITNDKIKECFKEFVNE